MPKIDYDTFGRCSLCHCQMLVEKIVDGNIKTVLGPKYDTTTFLLNDGSNMRVAICKDCKCNLTDKDVPKIMKSIVKGWQKEVDMIPHWSEKHKSQYMKKYSKKKIIRQIEGIPVQL